MRRRVALLVLLIAAPLHAVQPRVWELRGPGDLLAGELSGLSFDAAGHVTLAPALTRLPDPGVPFVWSLCSDGRGTLFAGTGNEGQVLRVHAGQVQPFFKAAELEIHALACAPDGRVFVGSSPDGKVYVVDAAGQAKPYFDPEGKYIWGLALDPQGRLLVVTGAPARLLRVDVAGQATELFASAETHLTALAVDQAGRAYVGSAPSGVVYVVEGDGRARVLIDSDYREVKALGVRGDGSVYAALFEGSAEAGTPAATPAPSATASGNTGEASVTVTESFGMVVTASASGATTPTTNAATIGRGALLRLVDGDVEMLWTSYEDAPFALLVDADGVLLGTGDKGRLLRVRDDHTWQLVTLLPAGQVTALARHAEGVALGSSNGGAVFTLAARSGDSGVFTSAVKDSGAPSLWGRLRLEARQREAGAIEVATRSGNSAVPDGTWSAWRPAVERDGSLHTDSPKGRYAQVRVTLAGRAGHGPVFDGLGLFHLPRNQRPEVTLVLAHPPGEVFQKPISVSGEAEVLGLLETNEQPDPSAAAAANVGAFSRKLRRRGLQTLSWRAQDANQDTLVYDVFYRPIEASEWRALRSGLAEPVLAWDTSALPDGRYVVKVVARDTPSNAPDQALAGERESAPFDVDNTPPSVSATRLSGQGQATTRVRVVALDRGGAVQRTQYSIDGQAWIDVHPLDGLADSPEETYEWTPTLPAGAAARVLMVRVTDQLGNVATAQVALR